MEEFAEHNPTLQETMDTHLIDLEEGVWDDDYDKFFQSRCEQLAENLKNFIVPRSIDEAAPTGLVDDSDPDAEQEEQAELEFEAAEVD